MLLLLIPFVTNIDTVFDIVGLLNFDRKASPKIKKLKNKWTKRLKSIMLIV